MSSVMRNERYCGDVLARKTWTPNFHDHRSRKNRGKKNKYYQPGHHEAIVTRAQWNAAQRILNSRRYGHDGSYLPMRVIDRGALTGYRQEDVGSVCAQMLQGNRYQESCEALSVQKTGHTRSRVTEMAISGPLQCIVSDMTAFHVRGSYYELTLYMDLWNNEIVSHSLSRPARRPHELHQRPDRSAGTEEGIPGYADGAALGSGQRIRIQGTSTNCCRCTT